MKWRKHYLAAGFKGKLDDFLLTAKFINFLGTDTRTSRERDTGKTEAERKEAQKESEGEASEQDLADQKEDETLFSLGKCTKRSWIPGW